jgi:hypothetical protein
MSATADYIKKRVGDNLNEFSSRITNTIPNLKSKGIVGSTAQFGPDLKNALQPGSDSLVQLGKNVVGASKQVLFGSNTNDVNQRTQAASGSQGSTAVNNSPIAFGGVLSKEQNNGSSPTTPSISPPNSSITSPATTSGLVKQSLATSPTPLTYGTATPQQIARRTGFQLETTAPEQLGTPIRGTGGQITSYSVPGYSGNTKEGSTNTLSFSNDQNGKGSITSGKVFSPEQVDSLNKTIEYNNKPETIKNFAEQAAISKARYDAVKVDPISNKLEDAYRRNDKTGISLYKDLLFNRDKTAVDREQLATQERLGTVSNEAQQATLERQTLKDAYDAQFKQSDSNQKNSLSAVNIINDLEKEGNTNAFQQLSAVKKATGRLDISVLDRTFGSRPGYIEARKLGGSALSEWVNTQEDAPPVEYMNEIFKRTQ